MGGKMKNRRNDQKSRSIFHYIISFSVIIILIIMIMGIYLYQFYYKTIYTDFTASNEGYLSAIADRQENDIQILNSIITQFGYSNSLIEFKLDENPVKSVDLKERLRQYTVVSRFFNQILLIYHEDTYLYNHNTSVHIDRFLKEGILLEDTTEEDFRSLLYSELGSMEILPEQEVSGYLVQKYADIENNGVLLFLPIPPKRNCTCLFIVGNSYYDRLLAYDEADTRQNLIIYDGQVIVSRGALPLDEEMLLSQISGSGESHTRMKLGGKEYMATLQKGDSGLLYCTVQPMDVFYKKILTDQWGILFVLLICSVPAALAITTLSRGISSRVRKMNALLYIDKDADYDLNNIELGIRALVENNKVVSKESLPLRRSKLIGSFIRNDYPDRETLISEGRKASLNLDREYFLVMLMGDRGNSNEKKAHEIMLQAIAEEEKADGYGIDLINNNQRLLVIFADDTDTLERLISHLFVIGKSICEDFIMSVSDYHKDYKKASQAYLEADTAFDNRFLFDNSKILRFADVALKEQTELLPDMYLHKLKNAIRSGKEEQLKLVINEICTYLQSGQQSLLSFRVLYNDIIHVLIKEWNPNDVNLKYIYSVFTLSQCLTMKDFNDILCEVCKTLMGSMQTNESSDIDRMTTAEEYMKENYHDSNLNMSSLADHLGVSPVTLSVEFKNKMGMSPSDYLTLIRIERAKELLKETDLRVKEISGAVGYEDDHVFMRRFKKYVGKTPAQFRDSSLKINEE